MESAMTLEDQAHSVQDEALNDLLVRWHRWNVTTPPETGFYTVNTSCKLYRPSRQYDWENGASDAEVETSIMEGVENCINQLGITDRTAIMLNARNLATGASVWQSPRLPVDPLERMHLVLHARARLIIVMECEGML